MGKKAIDDLLIYLDNSPTPYHAVAEAAVRLNHLGWKELDEKDSWNLEKNQGYYVIRNGSSMAAFQTGTGDVAQTGFRIMTAHTDSPALRLKSGLLKEDNGVLKISVESMGGPILPTWLDRNLSLAGKVAYQSEKGIKTILYRNNRPSVLIPNAAVHLNKKANRGFEYNAQKHLTVLTGLSGNGKGEDLYQKIAGELGIPADAVLDADLLVYNTDKAERSGWNNEFFTSGRIDNLAMSHAALQAILSVQDQEAVTLAALFDNEEVGSRTPQGADSNFLETVLERIMLAEGKSREDYLRSCRRSFLVSLDGAHALHPNFSEMYDEDSAPIINRGPVLKVNADWSYTSFGESASWFRLWCKEAGVPCQVYMNRSDMKTGKSLGPIASSRLGIPSVDAGNPMWSMHSIRETAGVEDHESMIRVLKKHLVQTPST